MLQTYVNEFLKSKARNVSDFVKSLFDLSPQVNLFLKLVPSALGGTGLNALLFVA